MFSIITFVGVIALSYSKKLASTVPYNYAILGVTTISTAYTLSYFTAFFDPEIVAQAALLTGSMVGGLTYYAWTSEGRFNFKNAFVYGSATIFFVQLMSMFLFTPDFTIIVLSFLFSACSLISILY